MTRASSLQRYPALVGVIEATVLEAITSGQGVKEAIRLARERIACLPATERTLTLEAAGALENIIEKLWEEGVRT